MHIKQIIEKDVNCCRECPNFREIRDANTETPVCGLINDEYRNDFGLPDTYSSILELNRNGDKSPENAISEKCPYLNGKDKDGWISIHDREPKEGSICAVRVYIRGVGTKLDIATFDRNGFRNVFGIVEEWMLIQSCLRREDNDDA